MIISILTAISTDISLHTAMTIKFIFYCNRAVEGKMEKKFASRKSKSKIKSGINKYHTDFPSPKSALCFGDTQRPPAVLHRSTFKQPGAVTGKQSRYQTEKKISAICDRRARKDHPAKLPRRRKKAVEDSEGSVRNLRNLEPQSEGNSLPAKAHLQNQTWTVCTS